MINLSELVFLLLIILCVFFIFIGHRYFSKKEFYLLGIIYTIISFLMSFKLISVFGMSINAGIIFTSGIYMLIYYFIKKYDIKEYKRFILVIVITSLVFDMFLLSTSYMIPSIYDEMASLYQGLVFDNLIIFILFPVVTCVIAYLIGYSFSNLMGEEKRNLKLIIAIIGIMFIDCFLFIYFSYAVLIRFDNAIVIAIENYFVKSIIMVLYMFLVNRIIDVKKVKV